MTSPTDVERLGAEACRVYGRVDALYVALGINVRKRLVDYTYEEFDRVVDLNLKGAFTLL